VIRFRPVLTAVIRILAILFVVYGLLVVFIWRYQDRLAFPAPKGPLPAPSAVGILDGRLITVITEDSLTLRGWYLPPNPLPPDGERAPALLWFYGNMETIGGMAPILRDFRPPGTGMLVLDYRGYGESDGRPTERGVYRDADAAWAYLAARPEIDSSRIAVYGRSIGSAVATWVATEHPVRAVMLESPFSSGRAMAREHYAFLPTFLARLDLDNLSRVARISAPLLVFHGAEDRIAPLEMGRAVAEAGRAEELVVLEGSGHNETYDVGGDAYRERFLAFLAQHLR
jgi:dipeptidyl aminopeptidase/acylaminoacyl peptidase